MMNAKEYVEELIRGLRKRTGLDLSKTRFPVRVISCNPYAKVTEEAMSRGLARAFVALQREVNSPIVCALPAVDQLNPGQAVALLVRMVSYPGYHPEPPRLSDWSSDEELGRWLRLALVEHMVGVAEVVPSAVLPNSVVMYGPHEMVKAAEMQFRFSLQIIKPEVLIMTTEAMQDVPEDRRVAFMHMMFEFLSQLDPTKEHEPVVYQQVVSQCRCAVCPDPIGGPTSAN